MIPKDVLYLLDVLEKAGHTAYIVGGSVRDMLIQKKPSDWDITTSATPMQVKSLFRHTYDTGIEHGTVTVLLHRVPYEVTTYRTESDYTDGRHPDKVAFVDSIEQDLSRRDFTINAIAFNPKRGFVDPFDGQKDIQSKIIRSVRSPKERFEEDALRLLRAVRFAAQLDFTIEENTLTAIKECKHLLQRISKERIREELGKILLSAHPESVEVLENLGLMPYVLDEKLEDLHLAILCNTPPNLVVRLAVLLQNTSAKTLLRHLKYDNATIKKVTTLLRYQDYFDTHDISKVSVKHFLNQTDLALFEDYLIFERALGKKVDDLQLLKNEIIEKNEPYLLSHLALSGTDLIESGIPKGKEIGTFLKFALENVIQDPTLNNKKKLLDLYPKFK